MKDEDIPMEPRYQRWLDEAAFECGMDICAMDVLKVWQSVNFRPFQLTLHCEMSPRAISPPQHAAPYRTGSQEVDRRDW